MFDRGKPSEAANPSTSPDWKMAPTQGSYMNNEQFYKPVKPLKPGEVVPSVTYMERGQRWMEKEEAVALRQAMEDKDGKDAPSSPDEDRLYDAALNEASELVWQHQHGVKPPEPGAPYRYRQHLRRDSYNHARTASAGLYGDEIVPTGLARPHGSRSVSGSSSSSDGRGSSRRRSSFTASMAASRKTPSPPGEGRSVSPNKSGKPYTGLTGSSQRRRSSLMRTNTPSPDQISEEPEATSSRAPSPDKPTSTAMPVRRNPFSRVSFAAAGSPTASSDSVTQAPKLNKYEIHRNPPSQSRNPHYTSSTGSRTPSPVRQDVPKKHGMEIRSDDIRQATSMKLKDRSPKLPTPSAVSDRPGRPIVSFDHNWKAPDAAADEKPDTRRGGPLGAFQVRQDHRRLPETPPIPSIAVQETREPPVSRPRGLPTPSIQVDTGGRSPSVPSISVTSDKPSIPTIVLPGDDKPPIPSIVLPGDDDGENDANIPVIVTPDDSTSKPTARPLPTPQKDAPRVRHAAKPRGHWSPAPSNQVGARATARCHECNLPIEGRFIALAGGDHRFHPQCFTCYICGTSLEALEISPEPEPNRAARLERISRRAAGEVLEEQPGETMAEDGDERLRFYCHLDWHELFAPRCKHCTTPILGEHIVALGNHWHYGHFFCAECGDPFEQGMTHIEKDGYAWCVNCQTKRTERRAPKCKKCRKAVIGQYIRALGGEWHDECFRCATCQGGFDDGQIFPRDGSDGEMVVLCTKCRARELKS
ncbi:hypothetical protein N0V93_003513 [Gnomoniopsis smithogilvyi]|uniref:LIM zinc-binding domain-containing protein n=1 Tax=Gnomoniopsis smithogilvyi TaxID=1191159 RepID=A0A9W8YYL2_9PEZI|nr:hypothetical protein N0V93_003513 [Gnomoniopsis smithogilvyi]